MCRDPNKLDAAMTTNMPGINVIPYNQVTAILFAGISPFEFRDARSAGVSMGLQGSGFQFFSDRNRIGLGPFSGQSDNATIRITAGYPAEVGFTSQTWNATWTGALHCDGNGDRALMYGVSSDGALTFTISVIKSMTVHDEGPLHN